MSVECWETKTKNEEILEAISEKRNLMLIVAKKKHWIKLILWRDWLLKEGWNCPGGRLRNSMLEELMKDHLWRWNGEQQVWGDGSLSHAIRQHHDDRLRIIITELILLKVKFLFCRKGKPIYFICSSKCFIKVSNSCPVFFGKVSFALWFQDFTSLWGSQSC